MLPGSVRGKIAGVYFSVIGQRNFLAIAIAGMLGQVAAQSAVIGSVRHVVHVSVDGLAAVFLKEAMTNAPGEFPSMWRLVTNGAATFNARCDFDDSTTMPNHTCMLTGRPTYPQTGMPDTTHHGYYWNSDFGGTLHTEGNPALSYQASVFDVAHDHGLSTALLASKAKFEFYGRTWNEQNGAPDFTGEDNGTGKIDFAMFTENSTNPPTYATSAPLVDALLNGLTNAGWNYSFIHFSETDAHGHIYGFPSPQWSNAVRHVDQQLARILQMIDTSPVLSNSTAIVLTADHGGDGLLGHGSPEAPTTYTIPLFVWGPGIPRGTDLYSWVANRKDPGPDRIDYLSPNQPLRDGDTGNIALALLGLPPIPGSLMRPEFAPRSFQLAIQSSTQSLTVSWPLAAREYALETSNSLLSGANWHEITDDIDIVNSRHAYNVPVPGSGPQFFRLRNQASPPSL